MTDDDIDFSDDPPSTDEERKHFKPSRFAKRLAENRKTPIEIDADILKWFSENFDDYRTELNNALREYIHAKRF